MDLTLPALAVTTGGDGKTVNPDDVLRRLLKVSEMDPRPVLLYFHYPHAEKSELTFDGRLSKKQCVTLVDEQVSRWSLLYRCYEVDMSQSDRATAERLGAAKGTSFAIVNGKLETVGKRGPLAESKEVAQFLRDSLQNGCPTYWSDIQKRLEDQKTLLAEARKLAAKKDWKAAKQRYDEIRKSDTRVGDFWDDVFDEGAKVDTKAKE